jgi:transposase-like protein
MIATADTTARRRFTVEEKLGYVKRFNERGDKPARELAEELCLTEQSLYLWARQARNGELVAPRPSKSSAIVTAPASTPLAKREPAPSPVADHRQLHIALGPVHRLDAPLAPSEREELVLLRAENHRLRSMLKASI